LKLLRFLKEPGGFIAFWLTFLSLPSPSRFESSAAGTSFSAHKKKRRERHFFAVV
jgi:hypothetical protein